MKPTSYMLCLFLLIVTCALAASDDSCAYHDTLFDIGLSKVLGLPGFEEFPLNDIRRTFTKFFDFRVRLSEGKLYGLSNLMRHERNFINVTDSGIAALFEIQGGPLRVSYRGSVQSVPVDAIVKVDIYIPRIEMMIYVEEPAPNRLTLTGLSFWNAPVSFRARQLDGSSIIFDLLNFLAEGSIEDALNDKMSTTVHEVVYQFLGMVELFARNGTKIGDVKKPLPDPVYTPGIILPGPGGSTSFADFPVGPWQDPSKWGVFDYSVKRIALASHLDPVTFTDVDDVTWGDRTFQINNVTVDGLAFLRRGGDNYARANRCGIAARVALAFENIRVQLYATTAPNIRLRMDVRIVALDAVIEVTETNKTINIVDYQLNFPVPLEYDVYVLTPVVGPAVEFFKGYMRRQLTEDEANKLEDSSKKYVDQAIFKITEFIKDPAPWMPWNNSIIEAYRKYSREHTN
ncbi:uncharacterized protein LOC144124850 [Amblyomma americanum]